MLQNKFKPFAAALVILTLALLLAACGGGGTIAEYEGGKVTEAEFNGFLGAHKFFNYNEMYMFYEMMPDFKTNMLHQYIATKLLAADVDKETDKQSVKRAKDDLNSFMIEIKANRESRESFNQFLDEHNMKQEHLQQYMASQYNLESLFSRKFTDEQLRAEYDENIAADKNAYISIATVRHILVSTTDPQTQEQIRTLEEAHERALEVQKKLKETGDWAALSLEYNDDPGSKETGGLYANENVDRWDPAFRQASIEQPLNEIGEPFESSFGYHVMVVEQRNSNEFEAVKGVVRGQLINEFFADYMETIPDLITVNNLPDPAEEAPTDEEASDGEATDGAEGDEAEGEATGQQ